MVRTHIRHVCGKLGAHGRTEAVARACALGPARAVSPCVLRFLWVLGTGINGTGLSGPERTGSHVAGWCRARIWVMGPAGGSDAGARGGARTCGGGVVARAGLFGRLGGLAGVAVGLAPPGNGKSVLLRSWIG